MVDKFIAACAAWERTAAIPWLSGLVGALNGAFAAAMLSMLWIMSPIFAIGTAAILVIAWRFLGWTKAHSIGVCIGALLTVVVELSLLLAA